MRFTGREGEVDRLYSLVPSRAPHILVIVVRDAGSVLVYPHDGGIDYLHRRVVTSGQCIHNPVSNASLPPTAGQSG